MHGTVVQPSRAAADGPSCPILGHATHLTFLIGLVVMGLFLAWIIPMLENPDAEVFKNLRSTAIILVAAIGLLQMFNGIVEAVSYALLRKDKEGVSYENLARVFE